MDRQRLRAKRKAYRRRYASQRRDVRLAAAALIAGATAAIQSDAYGAAVLQPDWQGGGGAGVYDMGDGYIEIDLDGDGLDDLFITGHELGSIIYGEAIRLTPISGEAYQNGVMSDEFLCCDPWTGTVVRHFGSADNVFVEYDLMNQEEAIDLEQGQTLLWNVDPPGSESVPYTAFETRGIVGVVFDIPGGSMYAGYLDLTIETSGGFFSQLVIHETGYANQYVPAPSAMAAWLGMYGLMLTRRRFVARRNE